MIIAPGELHSRGRLVRVGSLTSDRFIALNDPASAIANARLASLPIDVFTFVQTLPDVNPQFNYLMEWDNFAALHVDTFDHWWSHQINNKTRNMVRKGERKGLVVKEVSFDDALAEGIHEIYSETSVRQGKKFWHYGKDVQTVAQENATFREHSAFIGAFLNERLIGFVKLVFDARGGQAAMMQIVSMVKHRDKAPTNALIAQAVRSCALRGVPELVYSRFSYSHKHHDSLVAFKISNGFRRVEVPRYYVPLTVRGQMAIKLGFHHDLRERLPEGLLARFRELRRWWYAQGLQHEASRV